MSQLTLLLENLYNAPWPKSFNGEGFTTPELETIQDSKQIRELEESDQVAMAEALVKENEDLKPSAFHDTYIQPLAGTLLLRIKNK